MSFVLLVHAKVENIFPETILTVRHWPEWGACKCPWFALLFGCVFTDCHGPSWYHHQSTWLGTASCWNSLLVSVALSSGLAAWYCHSVLFLALEVSCSQQSLETVLHVLNFSHVWFNINCFWFPSAFDLVLQMTGLFAKSHDCNRKTIDCIIFSSQAQAHQLRYVGTCSKLLFQFLALYVFRRLFTSGHKFGNPGMFVSWHMISCAAILAYRAFLLLLEANMFVYWFLILTHLPKSPVNDHQQCCVNCWHLVNVLPTCMPWCLCVWSPPTTARRWALCLSSLPSTCTYTLK